MTTEVDLIEPIHPGDLLMEHFVEGFGIAQKKPAVAIGVPPRRINEIVHRKSMRAGAEWGSAPTCDRTA